MSEPVREQEAFGPLKYAPRVLAAVFCVQALAGCAPYSMVSDGANIGTPIRSGAEAPIPLPGRALLRAQPEPDCEFQLIGFGDTWLDADDAARKKLDYELQCYRRAEIIVRSRLRQLQASVGDTIKAIKRCAQNSW
jgi:hypothetical protein